LSFIDLIFKILMFKLKQFFWGIVDHILVSLLFLIHIYIYIYILTKQGTSYLRATSEATLIENVLRKETINITTNK
jgi:hypothetical protein